MWSLLNSNSFLNSRYISLAPGTQQNHDLFNALVNAVTEGVC